MAEPSRPAAPGPGELRAYALLVIAFVIMALNVIVGRAAHADVGPCTLSFFRWAVAALVFLPFSARRLAEQWSLVLANWRPLVVLSLVMVPFGNNLVYVGLQQTTALNGGLIAVARPVIILLVVRLLFHGPVKGNQWLGIAVAMVGVLCVLTRGDPSTLARLDLNVGDLWLVVANIGIACYQVTVGRIDKAIHPTVLLQASMTLGAAMMLPLFLWETGYVRPLVLTWPAIGAIGFVGVFPSVIAVYLINNGIRTVGAARMGIFNYLQPLLVAVIAIPVLGETLGWYHPAAFALVAGGILVSSRRPRQRGA